MEQNIDFTRILKNDGYKWHFLKLKDNEKNNSKAKIVLGIIIIAIIILLCAIYVEFSNSNNNFEEKPIGNRDILYFFILIYFHFHQQLCKCHLLIVNNFYNELLLELDLLLYIKIH